MNPNEAFRQEVAENVAGLRDDSDLQAMSRMWVRAVSPHKYAYNYHWMGRPIIQLPQDMMALQEIVWDVQPDFIIETGIAHGGSILYLASLLELLGGDGQVIGIDIDIRQHNRAEIEKHPMFKRVTLIEGSSVEEQTVAQVSSIVGKGKKCVVILDSNHTHEHVASELTMYSPFVNKGSYLVVFDTIIEDMPAYSFPDRPWGKGDNPKTAVYEFLKSSERFDIDHDIEAKILITVAPDGWLKCVKD